MGVLARLDSLPLPIATGSRPFWLLTIGSSAILLFWAALAEGSARSVRIFRATTLLLGFGIPLAALRFGASENRGAFGGALLVLVVTGGITHRALSGRRRAGPVEHAIRTIRFGIEGVGLILFAILVFLFVSDRIVPVRLAFWALFLLRLSVADLLDPSRMAARTGLKKSLSKDLKSAARPSRKISPGLRWKRGASGIGKLAFLIAWIALPILAALAPKEVAAGEWPTAALWLSVYPPSALILTALVLIRSGLSDLRESPADGARALVSGIATALYVAAIHLDPAFETYRHSLAGLYLAETLAAFLLGAVSRGR